MKYMQISLWKPNKVRNVKSGEMIDKSFYSVKWFKNPKFRKVYGVRERTEFIRENLRRTSRQDMNFSENVPVKKFEEVVVTEQGNHEISQALYHQKLKMPEKLINEKTKRRQRSEIKW